MRLISCHIQNFGRLREFDYDFEEGLNNIEGYNGWGKSTLAAFIRVMFYGFEGENKRSVLENERKRWNPWQGGVFGGSLVFSEKGKIYKITRMFGNKAAEDVFELRDASTNLESRDYTSKIGEELFGVNSESYMRTVYISQNDVATYSTDGINAKLGNIADDTGDIDCYEKAAGRLTELLNQNSPKRVTGKIYKLNSEISELQSEVAAGDELRETISQLEKLVAENKSDLKALAEYREANIVGQRRVAELKDIQTVMEVYSRIESDCNNRKKDEDEKRQFFPGEIPDAAELDAQVENAENAVKLKEKAKGQELNEEETEYLFRLREKYSEGTVSEALLTKRQQDWRRRDNLLREETEKTAAIKVKRSELDAAYDNIRMPAKAFIGFIIILLAVGMAVASILFLHKMTYIYAGMGMALVVAICGVLFTILSSRNHRLDEEDYLQGEYDALNREEKEVDRLTEERKTIEDDTAHFLREYNMPYSVDSVLDSIQAIRGEMDSYERMLIRQKEYYELQGEYEIADERTITYLNGLGFSLNEDRLKQLAEIKLALHSYNESVRIAELALREKENFEKEKDIDTLLKIDMPDELPELGKLTEELNQMTGEFERLSGELTSYEHQLEALYKKQDIVDEKKTMLEEKRALLLEAEERYHNLEITSRYLTEAKESLTSRYMGPLMKGFDKYYGYITGRPATEYRMDANINMTVEEAGVQHDIGMLSSGYRDLTGFCLRMSLIDAMYTSEKPVIVLDDPFVNLDSVRMDGARKLLNKLAEEYQVIYFSCH